MPNATVAGPNLPENALFQRPEFMSVNLLLQSYEIDFLVCHRCLTPILLSVLQFPKNIGHGPNSDFLSPTEQQ
jgi:hypothetical protein